MILYNSMPKVVRIDRPLPVFAQNFAHIAGDP